MAVGTGLSAAVPRAQPARDGEPPRPVTPPTATFACIAVRRTGRLARDERQPEPRRRSDRADCRHEQREGRPHAEFSWEGHDDSDEAHGRGWATLANDGSLQGRIHFHTGDDSGFRAVRAVQRSGSSGTG
jgi:hypothetical protein